MLTGKTGMKKLSEKIIAPGFGLALLILCGVGVASYHSVQRLNDNRQSVKHTYQVLETLNQVGDKLKFADDAGLRYIVTGKETYRTSSASGMQMADKAVKALQRLTIDNARQQRRLDELEPLITKSSALIQWQINSSRQKNADKATQIAITEQVRQIQQEIQAKLAEMDNEERTLLQRRSAATDASIGNTSLIFGIGYSLSFSLLLGVYLLFQKQRRNRQLAEAELQKRSQMLDFANDTIVIRDQDGKMTYWNQGAERLYGWKPEEVLGQHIHTFLQTVFPKPLEEITDECLRQGYWEGELKQTKRDGEQIIVASRWTLQRDEHLQPVAILEINNNVTERKQAESALQRAKEELEVRVEERTALLSQTNASLLAEVKERRQAEAALRKSEELYRTLARNFPSGSIFLFDPDLRYTLAEGTGLAEVGLNPEQLVGKTIWEALPPQTCGRIEPLYRSALAGEAKITEVSYADKIYRVHTLPVKNEQGEIFAGMAMTQDITVQKQAEQALINAREELEKRVQKRTKQLTEANTVLEAEIAERLVAQQKLEQLTTELTRSNQELEQFAYVASHDLQEPLRAVTSYTQMLARRYSGQLDEKADKYVGYIVDGATRMQQLIQDLLTYSRVGRYELKLQPTDCNEVLNRVLKDLQVAIAQSNAIVTFDVLPTVMADTPQIVQLFQNIIGNAIKYRGEEPPQVHISASQQDSEWLFSVRDNGIGIEPQYAERIFVIFQRLHTRKEYSGTGLGLAICKKIVERHGGRIWVESQPGCGSTFYFTLPIISRELD